MYSGRGFRESEIGDIDVILHEGVYHLFHLILPNHDYIAHATSRDGIHWKRVKNALWVGDPGCWDDDMLWTMHVSRCPEGGFQMFYTGLSQEENGYYQRLGRAVSPDLMEWVRDDSGNYPIESAAPHYETPQDNNRQWVSFRDPFLFEENGAEYLLFCARIASGSMSRRGCVGLALREDGTFRPQRPLFVPYVYDDVECPSLFRIGPRYYLLGSIREDVKVHYWYADSIQGNYESFHNNVLMPEGNYAARVSWEGEHLLVFAFYADGPDVETAHHFLPPPKELEVAPNGRLVLRSFWRWPTLCGPEVQLSQFPDFTPLLHNPHAQVQRTSEQIRIQCPSGYEAFAMIKPGPNWIWEGRLQVLGLGKCGLVLECDDHGDGYYISLDVVAGLMQIRAWGSEPANIYRDYRYVNLQTHVFSTTEDFAHHFRIIRYGHYIEFSLDHVVKLSLVDSRYSGNRIGIYCESAEVALTQSKAWVLHDESHFSSIGGLNE